MSLKKSGAQFFCPADERIKKFLGDLQAEDMIAKFFARATNPPFVSLLSRPLVCPSVPGVTPKKTMEIRFFAPASLQSHIDAVASLFGDAGDPFLPENDAALDVDHWTGQTGCVILAPHLIQKNGQPFKITHQDHRGVRVTVIADSDLGAVKKEVAAQIRYSALLYGLVELEAVDGWHVSFVLPRERVKHLYPDDSRSSVKVVASGLVGRQTDLILGNSISCQELPAFFSDAICRAAAAKEEPLSILDLNSALISHILTQSPSEKKSSAIFQADNIKEEKQKQVAWQYLKNENMAVAIPPLKALLLKMLERSGNREDFSAKLFSRENLVQSDWYHARLKAKQSRYLVLWQRHLQNLEKFLNENSDPKIAERLNLKRRLQVTHEHLLSVASREYVNRLVGTIGAQPL